MTKKETKKENKRKLGQRKYDCLIQDCKEKGRIIGHLGNIKLTYCPKHRKKGERILNYLINSVMRYKLTNFLKDSKQALFMKNEPKLCEICYDNLQVFVNDKIVELEEMEKTLPIEELEDISEKDLDDD